MLYTKFHHNLDNLLGSSINHTKHIAVAVSGGVDSIALLILLTKWIQGKNIQIFVMNVDHNLRAESKLESKYVQQLSENLGHTYLPLSWESKGNVSNLQERAREGRYKLITDKCLQLDVLTLLTAHHQDDYIENYCIRSERKSGIFGLSRTYIHFINNIRILRPLHNIEKQELISYLIDNNIQWFEDSSNLADKYHRNRIRKIITAEDQSFKEAIILKQAIIDEKVMTILKPHLIASIANSVVIDPLGFSKINLLDFVEYSKEIKLYLLSYILMTISGNNNIPRSVDLIIELIQAGKAFAKTLHGCIIKTIDSKLLIYREFGKKLPINIVLDEDVKWDNRFRFKTSIIPNPVNSSPIYITYLTMQDYISIKDQLDLQELQNLTINQQFKILFTLPVIKILEKVLALPHMSYYNDSELIDKINLSFESSFTSRFLHFY